MADKAIRYEFKKNDPQESKTAFSSLDDDDLTLIDIEDEYVAEHFGVMVYRDGKDLVDDSDGSIKIDLKNFVIHLPKEIVGSCGITSTEIPAKRLRYCGFPWTGTDGKSRNNGCVVVLSLWTDDWMIRNIYLVAKDAKSAMLLVTALTRFIFESSGKNKARANRFFVIVEGPVSVGNTSKDERDIRDTIRQNQAELRKRDVQSGGGASDASRLQTDAVTEGVTSKRGESTIDEYTKPIQKSAKYAVLDEEALCLYERPFSLEPQHDFRFYREKGPNSIDTIYVLQNNEHLEVQNGDKVYYLYLREGAEPESRESTVYKDLVETLRRGAVKPKTQTTFRGTGKDFEAFFAISFTEKPFHTTPPFLPQEPQSGEPPRFQEPSASTKFSPHDRRYPQAAATKEAKLKPKEQPAAGWLDNLTSGAHLLTVSEEMQLTWFSVEEDVDRVVKDGKVPQADMRSAGLDPNSREQLQNMIEHIKDKLMEKQFAEAVSQLRGCMSVYGQTLLAEVKKEREVELLKRIYFLSG